MYFKNAIDALGYTPLVELSQLSPNPRVHILAKLEGQNLGGSASTKDRIAKYMIEKAEQSCELTRSKTIIEATSGNTGIALAWLGRNKGYKVTIVMPDSMSLERQLTIPLNLFQRLNGFFSTVRQHYRDWLVIVISQQIHSDVHCH